MPPRKNDLSVSQATDLAHYFLGPDWRVFTTLAGERCLTVDTLNQPNYQRHYAYTWRAVFRLAGVNLPVRPQFSPQKDRIMQGDKCVAVACSPNFATRTANALNEYEPDRRGL